MPEGLQAAGRIYPPERWLADSWVSISDGKIKATMSLRAVGGRKCLSAHCFGWHCSGTVLGGLVPFEPRKHSKLHEPMQIQSWVGIFAQITPNGAPLRAHGRLMDYAMMKECR